MDLFEHAAQSDPRGRPLAERVRPDDLDDYFGQPDATAPGRRLRAAIEADRVPSLILWGPPGVGKTTLARIIAHRTRAFFEPFSAVLGGVKEIRAIVAAARERRAQHRQRTILFIDEIHRFNKSQQDALLPHLEDGTVTLIGATTENPSFELNAALLSRAEVVVLAPLAPQALRALLDRAMDHPARKADWPDATVDDDALDAITRLATGDARRALNTLEAALDRAPHVTRAVVAEIARRKILRHDKSGDAHYQHVSAFIKAMRGSDPDAAAYWLQRMVDAGEDPLFLLRRMVIFASEDIGLADPRALPIAVAAMDAFRFVGLPEGMFALMQAATYLACAPKSNTMLTTLAAARRAVAAHGDLPVPLHLRPASTALMQQLGHGGGYRYPHDFEGSYVVQDHLPDEIAGLRLFEPGDQGEEAATAARLAAWRARGTARDD
ncbi:MAG: replication-associated recombination protein A [Myxococcales bacterium]|nr:replication-associated recombination protein A [Myxococcales bacterium]MCB9550410.1 replication-associated recombination protein A [Myxococcales bacterium]